MTRTGRGAAMGAERDRVAEFGKLENGLRQAGDWYRWGPYVSERQWGTVREDYSADGDAWNYLPHDQARSRAYRWGEDGLAGFCDIEQRLCLALALWNGRDPILKERAFGLTGAQGNHGEDVKEYWWYLDAIPSHAWNRWRYHYPQAAFPYQDLIDVNASRNRQQPEYELLDTGVFGDGRYWIVEVHYAKAGPDDLLMSISVTNAGPDAATLHVLPTAWFRNTWSWDGSERAGARGRRGRPGCGQHRPPVLRRAGADRRSRAGRDAAGRAVLRERDERGAAVRRGAAHAVPEGRHQRPRDRRGAYRQPGPDRDQVRVLVPGHAWPAAPRPSCGCGCGPRARRGRAGGGLGAGGCPVRRRWGRARRWARTSTRWWRRRRAEADEFYDELTPRDASADEAMVMRQAFAGMLWSKQLYYYDVARWLDGDPGQPTPPPERLTGRNSRWRNFDAFDIMSMPDKWEYPWFAAWDLAFHCVALAHVDPAFAKYQLILLCREWFQHPSGTLPAYEWNFSDVNPPVQAWAALEVFAVDEGRDLEFLSRVFDKLLVNFTWWVNLEDAGGKNVYEGGFLGLDNIGPLDRSNLPGRRDSGAVRRHRVDGLLRDRDGPHRHRAGPERAAPGLRSGAQVPGALRRHPRRAGQPGPVGRHRRVLLRPAGDAVRGAGADQGPVDGGHDPGCWPPRSSPSPTCGRR